MTQYSAEWWYANGVLAANQRAAIFGPGNNNDFAPIFSDPAMTVPLDNPTTTDALGVLTFYAPDGQYFVFVGAVGTGDSVEVILGSSPGAVDSVNGQTGDVVLDAADVGAQPIATIDAKGDLYAGTGPDATDRLPVGADGQFLVADSSEPTGLAWIAGSGGAVDSVNGQTGVVVLTAGDVGADPTGSAAAAAAASQALATIDAKGDLYAGTGNNTTTRQPVGVNGQVLTADSGQPTGLTWTTPTAAPVQSVNGQTGVVVLTAVSVGADPAGSAAAAAAASQPLATIDAKGDLYVGTAADTTARLAAGADGRVLTTDSGQATGLVWAVPAAAPVQSVNGQTGVVVLTAGDVGADPAGSAAAAAAASQALATIDAKGDLYVGTAADTTARQPVGSDGQVLTADSGQATGLTWTTPTPAPVASVNGQTGVVVLTAANVGADPAGSAAAAAAASQALATIDAKGDLYAGTADNTTTRQPVGVNGQVLTADSGQATGLTWTTPTPAPVTSVNGQTGVVVLTAASVGADPAGSAAAAAAASQPLATIDAKGDLYAGTADNTTARRSVGSNGQVLTADSSQATGLVWATPTPAPVTSVNGATGVVVLTSTDVGAQPIATIDAKGDLYAGTGADATTRLAVGTDGFVLTADSAQSTGLRWAAAPVDAGAQQRSVIDAKGDLYVGTANDTTTRLAAGTDGFTLLSDSSLAAGLRWAIPPSVGLYPRSTGFIPAGAISTVRSSKSATLDVMFLSPIYILAGATLTTLNFEATANVATAVVRLGLYGSDSTGLPTGAPLADYGTVAAATTGTKTLAVSTALRAGLYWVAAVGQTAAPTLRFCAGQSPWVASVTFPAGSGVGWNNGFSQSGVSGALPSIGALSDTDVPLLGLKF